MDNLLLIILLGFGIPQGILLVIPTIIVDVHKKDNHWILKFKDEPKGNATNFFFMLIPFVLIWYNRIDQHPRGVLAQELFEIEYKRIIPILLAVRFIPAVARHMELTSHAIESIIAADTYGVSLTDKMESEAKVLTNYKQFKGFDKEDILKGLMDSIPDAREWIKEHDKYLKNNYREVEDA